MYEANIRALLISANVFLKSSLTNYVAWSSFSFGHKLLFETYVASSNSFVPIYHSLQAIALHFCQMASAGNPK